MSEAVLSARIERTEMGKRKKRREKLTRHHIKNTCDGGKDTLRNIIYLRSEKHQHWHNLFDNKDFDEVAILLLKADRIWKVLFGNKTFEEAAQVLIRASEMKRRAK